VVIHLQFHSDLSFKGQLAGLIRQHPAHHLVATAQLRGVLLVGALLPKESSCSLRLQLLPYCLTIWCAVFDHWRRYLDVLWQTFRAHDHR